MNELKTGVDGEVICARCQKVVDSVTTTPHGWLCEDCQQKIPTGESYAETVERELSDRLRLLALLDGLEFPNPILAAETLTADELRKFGAAIAGQAKQAKNLSDIEKARSLTKSCMGWLESASAGLGTAKDRLELALAELEKGGAK